MIIDNTSHREYMQELEAYEYKKYEYKKENMKNMNKNKEEQKYHGFGNDYAELYDSFYFDKDYDGETQMLEKILKQYGCNPGDTLLDIGCGTGNHAIRMAQKEYNVIGIDPSRRMLQIAKEKAIKDGVKIRLKEEGLPNLSLNTRYKGIECMFNVIDYVLKDEDVLKSFNNIYNVLDDKGVFIFDFRNAFPSLKEYSPTKVLHITDNGKDIVRVSQSSIDPKTRIFHTRYKCYIYEDNSFVEKFNDEHYVRAFFPGEIENFLYQSGFKLKEMFPFGEPGKIVNEEKDWNIVGVCTK